MPDKFIPIDHKRLGPAPASGGPPDPNNVTRPLAVALEQQNYDEALAKINGTPQERREAAQYFASRKNPQYLSILEEMGDDQYDAGIRLIATEGIVDLNVPAATPFFLRKLNDTHPRIRIRAAFGLRERGSPEVVDAISLRFVIEEYPEVQNCLRATLESIRHHAKTPSDLRYLLDAYWRAVPSSPLWQ